MGGGQSTKQKVIKLPVVEMDQTSRLASSFVIRGEQKLQVSDPFEKVDYNYKGIKNHFYQQSLLSPYQGIQVVHGIVGLENLGNTCYFNTAIHCLSHTQPLLDYMLSKLYEKEINTKNKNGTKGEVTRAFAKLLQDIWKDARSLGISKNTSPQSSDKKRGKQERFEVFLSPSDLLSKIQKHSKLFQIGFQEDCQELLSYLLDMLHEDLNRAVSKVQEKENDYHGQECREEWAAESWARHLKWNKSVIVDIFQGQQKSTVQCEDCKAQSHKFEPFLFLSLPIDEKATKPTLGDCLKSYVQKEKLESKWQCYQCKRKTEASKWIQLWKLPNVLIIHLKRFQSNQNHQRKMNHKVDFPIETLDLSEYVGSDQKGKPEYTLFAVAQHQGNLYRGHYTAACKNRKDMEWYLYNDDLVLNISEVQSGLVNQYAYLLFYQKTSSDEIFRQTLSKPDLWPHQLNSSNKKEQWRREERKEKEEQAEKKEEKQNTNTDLLILDDFQQQGHLDLSNESIKKETLKTPSKSERSMRSSTKKVKKREEGGQRSVFNSEEMADLSRIRSGEKGEREGERFELQTQKLSESMVKCPP